MTEIPLRDTPRVYGRVTRVLHWTIAALILWQYTGMSLRLIFGRRDFVSFFVGAHQPVGALLFVLIVARVVWALSNRRNRPAHGTGFIGFAAGMGHLMLYAAMIFIPAAGLLRAYGSDRPFEVLGVQVFAPQNPPVEWMVSLAENWHGEVAWVMGVLIVGHVAMVGLHEGMWRDGTLARMAGRR